MEKKKKKVIGLPRRLKMMLRRYLGKKVGTPDSLPSSRASLCSAGGAMSRRAEHERAR